MAYKAKASSCLIAPGKYFLSFKGHPLDTEVRNIKSKVRSEAVALGQSEDEKEKGRV